MLFRSRNNTVVGRGRRNDWLVSPAAACWTPSPWPAAAWRLPNDGLLPWTALSPCPRPRPLPCLAVPFADTLPPPPKTRTDPQLGPPWPPWAAAGREAMAINWSCAAWAWAAILGTLGAALGGGSPPPSILPATPPVQVRGGAGRSRGRC
jgi:hypothetical protein